MEVNMERNLGGLKGIERWLSENCVERLYEDSNYRVKELLTGFDINHKNSVMLAQGVFGEDDMLMDICTRYHDVGCVFQANILVRYFDEKIPSNALALHSLDSFIEENDVEITPEIKILRDVIYYYGRKIRKNMMLSEESRKYVDGISAIEAINQECIRWIYIFDRVAEKDYRDYNRKYPKLIGKLSVGAYSAYKTYELPEEGYEPKSYADAILLFVKRTITTLREYGEVARKAMRAPIIGYASPLAGYNYLIHKYLPKDLACEIELDLRKECYNPIEYTVVPDDENYMSSGEEFLKEIFDLLRRRGIENLPCVENNGQVILELDNFWELKLVNLDGVNMCFRVKYFENSYLNDQYTMRFTIP